MEGNSAWTGVSESNFWTNRLTLDPDGRGGLLPVDFFSLGSAGVEETSGSGIPAESPGFGYWGSLDLEMKAFWRVSRLRPPVLAGEKPTLKAMLSRRGSYRTITQQGEFNKRKIGISFIMPSINKRWNY